MVKYYLPKRRSSSIESCLPSKVFFHWRSYSIKGHLPSEKIDRIVVVGGHHNTIYSTMQWFHQGRAQGYLVYYEESQQQQESGLEGQTNNPSFYIKMRMFIKKQTSIPLKLPELWQFFIFDIFLNKRWIKSINFHDRTDFFNWSLIEPIYDK